MKKNIFLLFIVGLLFSNLVAGMMPDERPSKRRKIEKRDSSSKKRKFSKKRKRKREKLKPSKRRKIEKRDSSSKKRKFSKKCKRKREKLKPSKRRKIEELDSSSKKRKHKSKKPQLSKKRRNIKKKKVCLETQCVICLDDFTPDTNIGIMSCGHSLCQECIKKLADRKNQNCPICRKKIGKIVYGQYRHHEPSSDKEKEAAEKNRSKIAKKENKKLKEKHRRRLAEERANARLMGLDPDNERSDHSNINRERSHFRGRASRYDVYIDTGDYSVYRCPDCDYSSACRRKLEVHFTRARHGFLRDRLLVKRPAPQRKKQFKLSPKCKHQKRKKDGEEQKESKEKSIVIEEIEQTEANEQQSPAPANSITRDIQYTEQVSWPVIMDIRRRNPRTGLVLNRHLRVRNGRNVTFQRNGNFRLTILPSLIQRAGSLDCAYYTLFNGVSFEQQNAQAFRTDENAMQQFTTAARLHLRTQNANEDDLSSLEMEELIANINILQPLRGNAGGLAHNVSIIDGLRGLESAMRGVRLEFFEISEDDRGQIQSDVERISHNQQPQYLQRIGGGNRVDYTPHVLANIRRFRANGTAQTILLNTGNDHWITVRLSRVNNQDQIEILDSMYNGEEGAIELENIARRVYQVFRTDPLQTPQQQRQQTQQTQQTQEDQQPQQS